jgi:hypothetical protein
VLLRQGVAAWMRSQSYPVFKNYTVSQSECTEGLPLSNNATASMVQTMATMALASISQEVNA